MMMSSGGMRKALPPRPSQENNAYSSGGGGQFGGPLGSPGQNGYGSGGGMSNGRSGPMSPDGRTILEGYRNDIITGFEGEKPRYNPVSFSVLCNPKEVEADVCSR